jgi:putative ABC transport system substrate-binding protein
MIVRALVIAVFTLTLLGMSSVSDAQQSERTRRVGFLSRGSEAAGRPLVHAFRDELRALGYAEGDTVVIEWRWVGDRDERLLEMAADLVRAGVEVIVSPGTPETRAAREATSAIPIVMIHVGDPVAAGFVSSLARPGGNITGLSFLFPELSVKQLELFREVVTGANVIAVLWNPSNPSHPPALRALDRAAPAFGLKLRAVSSQEAGGLTQALGIISKDGIRAVLVLGEPAIFAQRARLAELASKHRIATMFNLRQHVEIGGLMAYGVHFVDLFRRAAVYVDKLLKGAKPADLPVEQPTRFELLINLKTAKALGLTVPRSILLRADQVIE